MYQYMAIPKKTFGGNFPGPDQKVSMECQSVNVQFYKTVSVQEYTLVLWLDQTIRENYKEITTKNTAKEQTYSMENN